MSDDWTPIFVLPNIDLQCTIGCDIAALVPQSDPRVRKLIDTHENFGIFLGRFSDGFGNKISPAILFVKSDAGASFLDIQAIASFRDIIAASVIPLCRAYDILSPCGHRVLYSESLAIFPYMLDKNFENLLVFTPGLVGLHDLSRFTGHSSPHLSIVTLSESDIDRSLFDELALRWASHYGNIQPNRWEDIALMRALNMAYHACSLPSGAETTVYDAGKILSAWVSAFEILVNQGVNQRPKSVGRKQVCALLRLHPWIHKNLHVTIKYNTDDCNILEYIFHSIYDLRIAFVHGNQIYVAKLITTSERNLTDFVAPVFRLFLSLFLDLNPNSTCNIDDPQEFANSVVKGLEFRHAPRTCEKAISTFNKPPAF